MHDKSEAEQAADVMAYARGKGYDAQPVIKPGYSPERARHEDLVALLRGEKGKLIITPEDRDKLDREVIALEAPVTCAECKNVLPLWATDPAPEDTRTCSPLNAMSCTCVPDGQYLTHYAAEEHGTLNGCHYCGSYAHAACSHEPTSERVGLPPELTYDGGRAYKCTRCKQHRPEAALNTLDRLAALYVCADPCQ
ncbi:hypothetical protein ACFYZ4_15105 [Streptomyces sp. NPDC001513]|uniref:hypothetical protein n=1 Tax=Streptomyces sp. NPDC001513 TaxID=3364580 RepID=UPI003686C73F